MNAVILDGYGGDYRGCPINMKQLKSRSENTTIVAAIRIAKYVKIHVALR
jgi:hypothetical protein